MSTPPCQPVACKATDDAWAALLTAAGACEAADGSSKRGVQPIEAPPAKRRRTTTPDKQHGAGLPGLQPWGGTKRRRSARRPQPAWQYVQLQRAAAAAGQPCATMPPRAAPAAAAAGMPAEAAPLTAAGMAAATGPERRRILLALLWLTRRMGMPAVARMLRRDGVLALARMLLSPSQYAECSALTALLGSSPAAPAPAAPPAAAHVAALQPAAAPSLPQPSLLRRALLECQLELQQLLQLAQVAARQGPPQQQQLHPPPQTGWAAPLVVQPRPQLSQALLHVLLSGSGTIARCAGLAARCHCGRVGHEGCSLHEDWGPGSAPLCDAPFPCFASHALPAPPPPPRACSPAAAPSNHL